MQQDHHNDALKRPAVYVIATPLGNLKDFSQRAIEIISDVDFIAAEDTRRAKTLLQSLSLPEKKIISYFDHNERQKSLEIIERLLEENLSVALISDAGTPCIADPGYRLIALAHSQNVTVIPVPGASAVATLISASGLPSDRFSFVGFLPSKASQRRREIESWKDLHGSVVFFETTRRLIAALQDISEVFADHRIAIGRELTKIYEEIVNLSIEEAVIWAKEHQTLKGEVSVMLSLKGSRSEISQEDIESRLTEEVREAYKQGKSHRDLMERYKDCGLERKRLYQFLLDLK